MKLNFCVADINYCVEFLDENAPYKRLLNSSGPFFLKSGAEQVLFTLKVGEDLLSATPTETATQIGSFDTGNAIVEVWKKNDEGYLFYINEPNNELACVLETDAYFTKNTASLLGNEQRQNFGLNNALMTIFAFAAMPHGVVLVHASVPMLGDKAFVFLGKSGTGKSTHSRLYLENIDGMELLNDDNPAIRVLPTGEVRVYGTPWSGKTPCYRNLSAQLAGVLRLEQASKNEIRSLSSLEAFTSLFSSCSKMIWDKRIYGQLWDNVTKIVEKVPSFYFKNLPLSESALLSYSTMCQAKK